MNNDNDLNLHLHDQNKCRADYEKEIVAVKLH